MKIPKTGALPDYIYRAFVEYFRSGRIPDMFVLARWDSGMTQDIFKNQLATKMKLCGNTLMCLSTGLPMVSAENFEREVLKVHSRGGQPGPAHRGIVSSCTQVRKKYSVGEVNFGVPEAEVRRISLRCPDPHCTHRLWKRKLSTGHWQEDVKPILFNKNDEYYSDVVDLSTDPLEDCPLDLSTKHSAPPAPVKEIMHTSASCSVKYQEGIITIESSPDISRDPSEGSIEWSVDPKVKVKQSEYVYLEDLIEPKPDNTGQVQPPVHGASSSENTVKFEDTITPTNTYVTSAQVVSQCGPVERPVLMSSTLFKMLHEKAARPKHDESYTHRRFADLLAGARSMRNDAQRVMDDDQDHATRLSSKSTAQHRFADLLEVIRSMRNDVQRVMVDDQDAATRLSSKIEDSLAIIADVHYGGVTVV